MVRGDMEASAAFQLEILEQGWLPVEPMSDPCSHGRVRIVAGGVTIESGEEGSGINTSALALLRTLETDHEPDGSLGLIVHGCGLFPLMDCPLGIDWSVGRRPGVVRLGDFTRCADIRRGWQRLGDSVVEVPEKVYSQVVRGFASKALEPLKNRGFLVPPGEEEPYRGAWEEFWAEYHERLRERAPAR